MKSEFAQEQALLLAQLEAQVETRLPAAQRPLFRSFLRHYYELSTPDALRLRSVDELFAIAHQHWQLAVQRKPGDVGLRIRPPEVPGRGLASIETVVEDMPFLVDSISMAVREAGSAIDWTVHPVLGLARDGSGGLQSVVPGAGESAESLIHIQCEPLAGAAAYSALEESLRRVIADLRQVVRDFAPMRSRLRELAEQLRAVPAGGDAAEFAEGRAFLEWLDAGHFTFLGYAETEVAGEAGRTRFDSRDEAALGLSRPGARYADADQLIAPREEMDKYSDSTRLVVVTKANHRATIHHPEYLDVVSVKRFRADGSVAGTCRFIGLFSSEAYSERPRDIPLIRRKAEYVLQRSRLPEQSHSGKNLREILRSLPRDELFQSGEEELFDLCMGIRALRDRQPLRLFMRRDRYGRFYSCLVYLPRERYSRELRDRIGTELMTVCNGLGLDRNTDLQHQGLARIHYMVRTPPGARVVLSVAEIEARLLAATHSWSDQLREILRRSPQNAAAERYVGSFPLSYQESVGPLEAAADLQFLTQLSAEQPLLPRLIVDLGSGGKAVPTTLKLYAWHKPLPLSDVLPALENFGLRVLWQDPTELRSRDGETAWLQQFQIQLTGECALSPEQSRTRFEQAFLATWNGQAENDGLNRLVLLAGLDARQVVCLRTLTKYLIQTGLPYSQDYMERLLAEHAAIARLQVGLFEARFDPQRDDARRRDEVIKLAQALDAALDKVATLDGDRVLRAYTAVVRAVLRTNYYQARADGHRKTYVSIKLDPRKVPELPAPLPMSEIFVYAPEVEGIHLRGGKVARGG
ncbi:MAG TPA: NAD-glutamate dehydrogenase domain-containing protein, partial [Solimonas sp.]|nr:NAD-glutamate dehydrogenase domain-containing protein [Solimonas sp.]